MKINTLKKISFMLVATGVATVALAQNTNMAPQNTPENNMPGRNLPERMLNRLTAQQFVTDAAVGGMKEVQISQIALDKSQNAEVRNVANHMIQDHSAANAKLITIAQSKGLDVPGTNTFAPNDPNWNNPMITGSEQVKQAYLLTTNLPISTYQDINRLKSLSGREFDEAYAKDLMTDHTLTIQEFDLARRDLAEPELRQFAAQTLPTLHMHSQMVQRLENGLNGNPEASQTAYPNNANNQNSEVPSRAQQLRQQQQQADTVGK